MPAAGGQGTASPEVPARPLLEVVADLRSARDHVWRWRWDLNPRKGCPFTRFRGVRPRPLGDSTAAEPTRPAWASAAGRPPALRRVRRRACGRQLATAGEELAQQIGGLGLENAADHLDLRRDPAV